MSFIVNVGGATISLQTESILDDLSAEPVSRVDIEALASMLAERFISLRLDTLLLQGLSNTLTLAILLAAWRVGLRVALIRTDAFAPNFEQAIEQLGMHLHIFYNTEKSAVFIKLNESISLFDQWIANTPTYPLLKEPYTWGDEQVALIFFTSGSTGIPKGVCHSLPSLIRSCRTFKEHYGIKAWDRIVCFAELHTNTGLRTLALALLGESRVIFIRKHKGTQAHELMALKNASFMICGPYMIEVLLQLENTFAELLQPKLKILSLGSYLAPTIIRSMYERYQIEVLNFYGLTETFGFALADKTKNTDDCLPLPVAEVSVSLHPLVQAENLFFLEIQSPNLFLGYLGEALTRKTKFNTGDVVKNTETGQLKFMGRASGAAKAKNGEWIFPLQLEAWIRTQTGVKDAVVKTNPPLTSSHLLSIFMMSDHAHFSQLTETLTEEISKQFGPDYHPIAWHRAQIERSIEGKVETIYA